ncbi:MAG: protein translocase subunit SecF [Patescibacteria group bacterium]|nr:protein translocase subunit SecF [Patescibacteria group bacterium]
MILGDKIVIDFLRYKKIYFLISGIFLFLSIGSLGFWGLRPSIDFTGGSILELSLQENTELQITNLKTELGDLENKLISVQEAGDNNALMRLKPITEDEKNKLVKVLGDKIGEVSVVRFETVGPTLGRELLTKTLIAVVLAIGFIMAYAAWQFKDLMYGICAALAMLHDSLILVGSFAILGYFLGVEVDTLFVTAVLTTLSLSVHDTVVVFNSIRQEAKRFGRSVSTQQYNGIVNRAINATIVRALNDSFTIIFMLLSLVLLGGETIRWFAVALLIGTILGTYSSTFIAAPLLTVWKDLAAKRK